MPIYVQLSLITISLYSFIIRSIYTDVSWVSIYYNGFTNVLFMTYFLFMNSLYPSIFNLIFVGLFLLIFLKQSVFPIRERIVLEREASIVDIRNLKKTIKIINNSQPLAKVHASMIFEILIIGTYQPKYMLKVLSYLLSKEIIKLNDQFIVINKHISPFTCMLLYIGFVPPHEKVEINVYQ